MLYFLDSNGTELVPEYRYVPLESIKNDMYKTIVEELIKGSNNSDYISPIPKNTKINSIKCEGNKVILDLSSEYSQDGEKSEEQLGKVYSIVNSLTEIKEIEEVEIQVDGEKIVSKSRLWYFSNYLKSMDNFIHTFFGT